jgi:Uma2 family endonuclease
MAETLAPAPGSDAEPRLRYRASDVRTMIAAGVLDDEQRYEVLDGEIVPMMVHNPPHINVKRWLLKRLTLDLGETYWVDSETTFYLEDDGEFTLPDILVYPQPMKGHEVRGPDALLLIEVADKSLKKDRTRKARLYARFGVRDYWVVDAAKLITHIYREPQAGTYQSEVTLQTNESLTPLHLPQVHLKLADI